MFSLKKLAYASCTDAKRRWYDGNVSNGSWKVDVQECCVELLRAVRVRPATAVQRLGRSVCENAARHGHADCLRLAHRLGVPWDKRTCELAALNGHLECLEFAHHNGCPWDKTTCSYAAGRSLECLEFAHSNGCPWDKFTCTYAAFNGRLDCLRYAHRNGCPWDAATCEVAAANGHSECLRYARAKGCPWDAATCEVAAANGRLECLRCVHDGCPSDHRRCTKLIDYDGFESGCARCREYVESRPNVVWF